MLGEPELATWQVGLNQLQQLRHIRSLLPAEAVDGQPKLLLCSRQGFTRDLIAEARTSKELELIALPRLHHGS